MYQAVCPRSSSSPTDTDLTFPGKSISSTSLRAIILAISSAVVLGMSSSMTSPLGKTYLLPHVTASTDSGVTSSLTSSDPVGSSVLWSSSSIICFRALLRITKSMIMPSSPMSPSSLSLTMYEWPWSREHFSCLGMKWHAENLMPE